MSELKEIFL